MVNDIIILKLSTFTYKFVFEIILYSIILWPICIINKIGTGINNYTANLYISGKYHMFNSTNIHMIK